MSSLGDFLGEIGRHQLLTPERELTMGRKSKRWLCLSIGVKRQEGKVRLVNIPKWKEKTKIREKAKNEMITANLRLVVNPTRDITAKG